MEFYTHMNTRKRWAYMIGNACLLATLVPHAIKHIKHKTSPQPMTQTHCIHKASITLFHHWLTQAPKSVQLESIHWEKNRVHVHYIDQGNHPLIWLLPWESSNALISVQQKILPDHRHAIQASLRIQSKEPQP